MENSLITSIVAVVGAITGVAGLVLSLINTWRDRRVNLRIIPQFASLANTEIDFGIEVINLSSFPVTLTDLGFWLDSKERKGKFSLNNVRGYCLPKTHLPARLEPRESFMKCFDIKILSCGLNEIHCAYAQTSCGTIRKGTSVALKSIKEEGTK